MAGLATINGEPALRRPRPRRTTPNLHIRPHGTSGRPAAARSGAILTGDEVCPWDDGFDRAAVGHTDVTGLLRPADGHVAGLAPRGPWSAAPAACGRSRRDIAGVTRRAGGTVGDDAVQCPRKASSSHQDGRLRATLASTSSGTSRGPATQAATAVRSSTVRTVTASNP